MANRIQRTVSITPQAEARIRQGTAGISWNASAMLEEAVWTKNGNQPGETKEAFVERFTNEARVSAEREFEKQQAQQTALRAPYEERLNSLTLLWKQAIKDNGVGSYEEKEVSDALEALIAEAKTKGVTLVKPEYAHA